MPQQNFEVSGRTFRTKQDYMYACKDAGIIEKIKQKTDFDNIEQVQKLYEELLDNAYQFYTLLGDDFTEEVEEQLRTLKSNPPQPKKKAGISLRSKDKKNTAKSTQRSEKADKKAGKGIGTVKKEKNLCRRKCLSVDPAR